MALAALGVVLGSTVSNVSNGRPAQAATPADRIVYSAQDPTAQAVPTVHIVNADGSGDHVVGKGLDPVWSPDDTQIAYDTTGAFNNGQVMMVQPDGAGGHTLVAGSEPSFSPESRSLTYLNSAGSISTVNEDGSGPRVLVNRPASDSFSRPMCSPLGNQVAFAGGSAGGGNLEVVSTDGSGLRTVVSCSQLGNAAGGRMLSGCNAEITDLAWSPDGSALVFAALVFSAGDVQGVLTHDLVGVVNTDGSGLDLVENEVVGESSSDVGVAWSPGGDAIAYAGGGGSVHVVDVARPNGSTTTYAGSAGSAVPSVAFSPDGTRVLFGVCSGPGETMTIETANRDGSSATTVATVSLACDEEHQFSFAPSPLLHRYAGTTRIDTAVEVAQHTYTTAPAVVLARADLYPDALAGGPLAAKVGAPCCSPTPPTFPPRSVTRSGPSGSPRPTSSGTREQCPTA